MSTEPRIPKSIVVYSHYGHSVYFDGVLKCHYGIGPDGHLRAEWGQLCDMFGIAFDWREVKWQDWPGQDKNSSAVHNPPKLLATVEQHFAALSLRRKQEQLESAREEVKRLEAELGKA